MKHRGDERSTPCLSMDEIKALFMDILLRVTETSSATVEWTMMEMLQHPTKKKKRVKEEIEEVVGDQKTVEESHLPKLLYLDAVIKETLRLHPTVPFLVPATPAGIAA
ncbi:hypothetical protein SLA2020_144660 [Shorea laevis]